LEERDDNIKAEMECDNMKWVELLLNMNSLRNSVLTTKPPVP